MKVLATFVSRLMSNHTTNQTMENKTIEISIFLKFGVVTLLKSLRNVVHVENLPLQIKILSESMSLYF